MAAIEAATASPTAKPGSSSWASSSAVRAVMRGNRKRDTNPELAIRRLVHARGLRYRVAARPLRSHRWTADLVFRSSQVAVFIDGCYWHGCPEHYKPPRTNAGYWGPKIAGNRERDARVNEDLAQAGWQAIRIWEHQDPIAAAHQVETVVRQRLASGGNDPVGGVSQE